MKRLKARPTTYNGIEMRSRLEARFASGLDKLGVTWVYEPRAYASTDGQYLPDFQISSLAPTFIEVKPTIRAAGRGLRSDGDHPSVRAGSGVVHGVPPISVTSCSWIVRRLAQGLPRGWNYRRPMASTCSRCSWLSVTRLAYYRSRASPFTSTGRGNDGWSRSLRVMQREGDSMSRTLVIESRGGTTRHLLRRHLTGYRYETVCGEVLEDPVESRDSMKGWCATCTCETCHGEGLVERLATPEEVSDGCELGVAYDPCPECRRAR